EPVATTAARLVLGRLFLPAPLKYELPYPLHEFLRYLALRGDVLFRWMPGPPLAVLEPTVNTDAHQREVRAVFASGDPLWALFFGTLRQRDAGVPISIRNAAIAVGSGPIPRRYYYFSLNREYAALDPWTDGTMYLLPREGFRPVTNTAVRFDEWLSTKPVRPLATLAIAPA